MTSYQSNSRPEVTDAERVAGYAAEALQEGRLMLGYSLAQLALRAKQSEDGLREIPATSAPALRVVPDAPVGIETPRVYEQLAGLDRDPLQHTALMDAESIRQVVDEAAGRVHRPPTARRCDAPVIRDGAPDTCRQGMFWAPQGQHWSHVDRALDADHTPVGPAQ